MKKNFYAQLIIGRLVISILIFTASKSILSAQQSVSQNPQVNLRSLLPIVQNGKWNDKRGYIDRTGRIAIEPCYARASQFNEGLAVVKNLKNTEKELRCFYINKTGRAIIADRFYECDDFKDGAALAETGNRIGYIDTAGKYIYRPDRSSHVTSKWKWNPDSDNMGY